MTIESLSKPTRIIVEGPDCSGKSTLVERLKNSLRWDSKSLHHLEGNQFFRYLKEYATQEKIVFDRSHFSEEVYSEIWRDGSPFTKEEKEILDRTLACHAVVIFALPSKSSIIKRYNSRNFYQQIKLAELLDSYHLFERESKVINSIIYRSESYEELDNLVLKVREMVE